jgi:hypothetical protein
MTPEEYTAAVRKAITNLAGSKVGEAVLHTIKLWKNGIRISPPKSADMCGLETSDTWNIEQKDRIYNDAILPIAKKNDPTAVARRAVVHFMPRLDMSKAACKAAFGDPTRTDYQPSPEEVLIHELVHAIRRSTRTIDETNNISVGSGKLEYSEGTEEFTAILVENMFQSEKNANIRFSHNGFQTVEPSMRDSFGYFGISKNASAVVEKFVGSNPFFTGRLAKLKVPFNPIAAFLRDPQKCRQMSNASPTATPPVVRTFPVYK